MSKRIDLTGRRFGRWTVIAYAGRSHWCCVCDCGARGIVCGRWLRKSSSKSCGCLCRELSKARATKHGMSGSREYRSWEGMKQRCFNPRAANYENYGGQGITVCEEWLSFEAFFADMGTCPPGYSLDRIDPNGNYEPGNCRWADAKQQRQNQRPRRPYRKRRQAEPPPLDAPPF